MQETRRARLASVIQEELALRIRELKDPRVPMISLTQVEVASDGSHATVYFSLLEPVPKTEEEHEQQQHRILECEKGLESAKGFLRRYLAKALSTRHIPSLRFKPDRGLSNAFRVHELLEEVKREGSS